MNLHTIKISLNSVECNLFIYSHILPNLLLRHWLEFRTTLKREVASALHIHVKLAL